MNRAEDFRNNSIKKADGFGGSDSNHSRNNYNRNNRNNNNRNNGDKKPPRPEQIFMIIIIGIVVAMLFNSFVRSSATAQTKHVSYSEFIQLVEDDQIETVRFTPKQMNAYPKMDVVGEHATYSKDTFYYYTGLVDDPELMTILKENNVDITSEIPVEESFLMTILSWIVPMLVVWLLMSFLMRRMLGGMGGMGQFGKSHAKVYVADGTGVTFRDVAGQDEAKESLMEIVDYLHNPGRYTSIGAKLPKGALLVGPPGTGKTLLAKAVAGEAGVPYLSISGSEFVELFVGMGASRVRDLFKQAQEKAPCIIFIDEIDAIGKSRDNTYGNDEREQTLNQLLTQMDGFTDKDAVVVLAATNRPEVLDKALLRPGRFDRRIAVTQPDKQGRIDILKVHSKKVKLDETVDLDEIALATSGASGADLANIVNEAALRAVRFGRNAINQDDMFESVEVIIAGQQRKNHIMSKEEREIVAFHEIGHALVAAKQKNTQPVQKITIIPRTSGALGYTMQMPEEEHFLMKKVEMMEEIVTYLGGRAAEDVYFNTITTGASNDIQKATDMARKMVTQYGMSDEFGMMGLEVPGSQYMDGRPVKLCSDDTMAKADEIVRKLLADAYEKAKTILIENRVVLERSAKFLLEKETITGPQFMEILAQGNEIPEEKQELIDEIPVEDKEQ